jgi:hypothetical protein
MTFTGVHLPVEHWLAKSNASVHALIVSVYGQMLASPPGQTRKQTCVLLSCGPTTERELEKRGVLTTWVDGANVRVGSVSIFTHILDSIVASHPVDGPARKARQPTGSYQKGHRNKVHPHEEVEASA